MFLHKLDELPPRPDSRAPGLARYARVFAQGLLSELKSTERVEDVGERAWEREGVVTSRLLAQVLLGPWHPKSLTGAIAEMMMDEVGDHHVQGGP